MSREEQTLAAHQQHLNDGIAGVNVDGLKAEGAKANEAARAQITQAMSQNEAAVQQYVDEKSSSVEESLAATAQAQQAPMFILTPSFIGFCSNFCSNMF